MENDPNNANAPATKADLAEAVAATKGEFKELFNTQKEEMERLLADQSNVILEAVDERMDKKLNEKFDPVMTKLDGIMKGVEALQQENTIGAEQLRRHTDQLSTRPASQSWRPHRHQHKSFSPMLVRKCDSRKKEIKKENAEVVVGLGWPTYSFCTRCGKPIIAFLKKRKLLQPRTTR